MSRMIDARPPRPHIPAMPLHLTKIAFGCTDIAELRAWLESRGPEARLTTRYLPKRHAELAGGSLYWIHGRALAGRSPLIGFAQKPDGKWWIRLEPRLIALQPRARRAHQGWRYLEADDAPPDLGDATPGDAMPNHMVGELARLGLV